MWRRSRQEYIITLEPGITKTNEGVMWDLIRGIKMFLNSFNYD